MRRYIETDGIKSLIDTYLDLLGEVVELQEGVLGYGTLMLYGKGLKTTIIQEIYLNPWSSTHTIRTYRRMPRKYQEMLKKLTA